MPASDILPSTDADQLIDFTCASPWERLALDIELELRSWGLHDGQQPSDHLASANRHQNSTRYGGSSLEPAPLTHTQISLGDKLFSLELRVSKTPSDSLDATPLERLLGVSQSVMLTAATRDGIAADDASDASVLLSAMCVAAASCSCPLPMLVPVGRPSSLRFIGRQLYPTHLRFSCDYTHQLSQNFSHVAGLLSLFRNKRTSAQRRNPPSANDARISAKFTYDWNDFSFKLAPTSGTFLSDRQLAAVQLNPLAQADPITRIRVAAIWDDFAATDLQRNETLAAMPASTASSLRIMPAIDVLRALSSNTFPPATIPMASAARATMRLARLASNAPDGTHPAAPLAVIDITCQGSTGGKRAYERRFSSSSTNAGRARSIVPPNTALDEYLVQVADYVAAAAIQDSSIDEEFLTSAVAALFEMDLGRGIMDQVVEALGPNAAELTTLERVSRLIAVSETVNAAQKLWNLFVDGVEVHWEQGWIICGVPFSTEDGPNHDENLITQKLQMINCCVERRRREAGKKSENVDKKGRKRLLEGVQLVSDSDHTDGRKTGVWEPFVQAHPLTTRDMVEEELKRMVLRAENGEGADEMEVKRQSLTLKSDMMAFKAANPDATMADFVRWFSPADWSEEHDGTGSCAGVGGRSGRLSRRMSRPGNMWEELWNSAEAIAAHEQEYVFDSTAHGSKAIADLRAMSMGVILSHLSLIQCHNGIRILQRAFNCRPHLKRIRQRIEQARLKMKDVNGKLGLGDLNESVNVDDVIDGVASAEYCALLASSLMQKLPPSDGMYEVIDRFCCGGAGEVRKERERELVIRTGGLDDDRWRSMVLPEWREFALTSGNDRMYARLSRDEFRVAFRLRLAYA